MNIKCYNCKMPISVGQAAVNLALNIIEEDDLVHFDFRCPKCKKTNKVSKEQLLHAAPGWKYEATGIQEKTIEERTKPEPKTESKAESIPKPKPTPKSKSKITPKPKPKAKTGTKVKSKPRTDPILEVKSKPKNETKAKQSPKK